MTAIAVVWCPFYILGGITLLIAYQVILLILIIVSFSGAIGEKKDIELRKIMTYICIFSILASLITVVIV